MRVLGIDPGIAITGWGVIHKKKDSVELVEFDCIRTNPKTDMPERLLILSRELSKVVRKHKPDVMVVEQLFFNSNAKTAITVGQARGIAMMVAAKYRVRMFEYTALTAKMELSGYGRSSKGDIQKAVQRILGLHEIPKPDDAADAIAIALCHIRKKFDSTGKILKLPKKIEKKKDPRRKASKKRTPSKKK